MLFKYGHAFAHDFFFFFFSFFCICVSIAAFSFAYLRLCRTLVCRATTLLMKLTFRMNNGLNLNLRRLSNNNTNPNLNPSWRQSRGCVERLQRSRLKMVTLTLGGRVSQVMDLAVRLRLVLVLDTTCPNLPS